MQWDIIQPHEKERYPCHIQQGYTLSIMISKISQTKTTIT